VSAASARQDRLAWEGAACDASRCCRTLDLTRDSFAAATLRDVSRRQDFAKLLPIIVREERNGEPVHLADIYDAVERDHAVLVDDEVEPDTGAVRWKHELRWELETLVGSGDIRRRKDLGRGLYST